MGNLVKWKQTMEMGSKRTNLKATWIAAHIKYQAKHIIGYSQGIKLAFDQIFGQGWGRLIVV